MAFSGVLFMISLLGICHHARSGTLFTIGKAAFDAFTIGLDIFDFFSPDDATDAIQSAKIEILNKLDVVLTNINDLHQTVTDLFFQLKMQIMLQTVEAFERSTESRLRDAENIVLASDAEREKYIDIFLEGIADYLVELYGIIPYVIESSLSSDKSILQLLQNKTDCHLTEMHDFNDYVRNLVLSGISIETMYKKQKFNLSLELERQRWENILKSFDDAVDVIDKDCYELLFRKQFYKDILKEYASLYAFRYMFEQRYDKSFLIIELYENEIKVSNNTAHTFHCVYRNPGCNRKTCFLYHDEETLCEDMLALRIEKHPYTDYLYEISEDYEAAFVVNLVENTDFLLPRNCFWKTPYTFYELSAEQITTQCSSVKIFRSEIVIFMALAVFVFISF